MPVSYTGFAGNLAGKPRIFSALLGDNTRCVRNLWILYQRAKLRSCSRDDTFYEYAAFVILTGIAHSKSE
ncbi:MAG: hypothetical protein DYG98_27335 [Haliscomenobacteraceae bacterium CHB4]|nr:hypothetical protein [Saprospiraceae bacterium]MCE7926769.1 hypothetical protein [Haliscomenobacteraceae bacterium CHB4]